MNICCCKGDMCNQDITTKTSATSSAAVTDTTDIVNGVICDKFMEGAGARRVEACPGEEYCSYVTTDMGDDDFLSISTSENYCIEMGEGCFEEVAGNYEGAEVNIACCCKGNMCNKRNSATNVVLSFVTCIIVL